MVYDCGLILEGGGMRGLYTAGVLDFFQDRGIEFNACYGVSAGAVNGLNYIAKQKGRMYRVNVNYLEDKNYAGIGNLIFTGNFFGTEMCYHTIPEELDPFDYETFRKYKGEFYVVITDCETGLPQYVKVTDLKKQIDIVRASCSLPLMAEMVSINGKKYMDGGLSDSIPVRKSVRDGHKKNIIILTRDIDYQKKKNEALPVIRMKYREYPGLIKALEKRHIEYNRTIEYVKNQEKNGNVYVIRPSKPITIGRLENDKNRLTMLYHQGYKEAKADWQNILDFLTNLESE
ncbi:MAG: patatin family protein [Lachnospiraceae bacterium]|nr:patatin family protein [Lachnospiraceae bacterium]